MSSARTVASAVVLSLALHGALAVSLRTLGFGRPPGPSPVNRLPPLVVDLIEPIVAVPVRGRVDATTATPRQAPDPTAPGSAAPLSARDVAAPSAPPQEAAPARPAAPRATSPAPVDVPDLGNAFVVLVPEAAAPLPLAPSTPLPHPSGARSGADPLPFPSRERVGVEEEHGEGEGREGSGVAGGGEDLVSAPAPVSRGSAIGVSALPGGAGTALPPEYDGYVRALRHRIQERLVYPWLAVRQRVQGVVELEFHLDPEGRLARVDVVGGEAAVMLREAALRAVRDATPLPFPLGVAARPLTIRLPVVFELR